jgi:hypothetical protein
MLKSLLITQLTRSLYCFAEERKKRLREAAREEKKSKSSKTKYSLDQLLDKVCSRHVLSST